MIIKQKLIKVSDDFIDVSITGFGYIGHNVYRQNACLFIWLFIYYKNGTHSTYNNNNYYYYYYYYYWTANKK